MRKKSVLMVCLGNICRSPLAHGIFGKFTQNTEITIDSAGTAGYHVGSSPDKRSISIARKKGIDISNQKSRKFQLEDFDRFDVIFAMDKQNFYDLKTLARNKDDASKIHLLLENAEVEDPYYGGTDGFEKVFDKIEKGCQIILQKWNIIQ